MRKSTVAPPARQARQVLRRLARRLTLLELAPSELHAPERLLRKHPERQRKSLSASIQQRGFIVPVTATADRTIVDGVLRWQLAQELGLSSIPVVCVEGISPSERQLLSITLNRIPDLSIWDNEALALDFKDIFAAVDLEFTVEASGFSTAEIDVIFEPTAEVETEHTEDDIPEGAAVSRLGDLWLIGDQHRLLCGNARETNDYRTLCGVDPIRMVCTDPPYNVAINGHVSGLGKVRHREFVEASGEMSSAEFKAFLLTTLNAMASICVDGGILFTAIDWRHLSELLAAAAAAKLRLINVCVWAKSNGGMGSLYRSQHELFLVWKKGDAPHVNNVNLGAEGRYRTNVWTAAGQNSFGQERDADLALHPTVKPVSLIAEAIRDVSLHGDCVLDPFAGSGTILLAAEKTQRRARAMELDPGYVDVAIRRYQQFRPDVRVVLAMTGETFSQVEDRRTAAVEFDDDSLPDTMWDIL